MEYDDEESSVYTPPQPTAEIGSFLQGSVIQHAVYHGTNKKFDQFQYQDSKRFVLFSAFDVKSHGFFFSEDYTTAKSYGRNIVTAYVNVKKPLFDPRQDKHLGVDQLPANREAQIAFILRHMILRHPQHGQYGDIGISTFPVYARGKAVPEGRQAYEWIYHLFGKNGLHWDCLDNPQVVASMKRLGYDGTFVGEDDATGRSIFVPDASQIKIVEWTK